MVEIFSAGEGEYTEKKSKFLGVVASVKSEEEAVAFLEAKKKQYHDARHNCSAWRICGASGEVTSRFSDDGEPSGTAGKPMLEVLEGAGVVNAICVVTRYFGGVLLGTGGLVRAYTESAKRALAAAQTMERRQGQRLSIATDYHGYGKIEYLLRAAEVPIVDTRYESEVILSCVVAPDQKGRLEAQIVEATSGLARLEYGEETGFAVLNGEVVFL
ncbi:MAG: YigZ family protein [Lachnospiraceae bacterium]|nr:YigZ family protein [Lachnospiraceae bacterium]